MQPFSLRLVEDAGVDRRGEVAECGLPFARGALKAGAPVALLDAGGRPLPAQFAPLAFWDDGSVRWLHAVFPLSLAAGSRTEVRVQPGTAPPAVPNPVRAQETPEGITVDTGVLRFRVDRKSGLLADVALAGVPSGVGALPLTVVRTAEGEHRAGVVPPDDLALEAAGPLMARIRVGGWLSGPGGARQQRVTLRIEAYAGSAELRVLHTWAVMDGPAAPRIHEIALEFPMPGARAGEIAAGASPPGGALPAGEPTPAGGKVPAGGPTPAGGALPAGEPTPAGGALPAGGPTPAGGQVPAGGPTRADGQAPAGGALPAGRPAPAGGLPQTLRPAGGAEGSLAAVEGYTLERPGAAPVSIVRPTGCFAIAGERARLAVGTRHFWQQGPKGVRLSADGARLLLYAGPPIVIGRTRAKSHDLRLSFAPAGRAGLPAADLARAWERPLLPIVEPAYLCATEALAVLSPVDRDFFPALEDGIAAAFRRLTGQTEADPAAYGLMDFGDWPLQTGAYGHKATAYVDQEYDTTHALLQLFARSGDRRYFDVGEPAARHYMDVDVNQVTGEPRFHGYSDACETHRECTTGLEWGHIFADGLVDFYYLTGDPRALDVARRLGDVATRIGAGEGFAPRRSVFCNAERNLGWPLLTLMRVYEATREEKYLQAAGKVVAYLQHFARDPEAEFQHGAWWRTWMMDGCKPFMVGVLYEGLDKHHELTGDKETRAAILKSLDWMAENMWNPERECFLYEFNAFNPGHRNQYPVSLNTLVAHAYGYAYRLTGEERYRDVGLRALRSAVDGLADAGNTGKDFGIAFRSALQVIGHFYRDRQGFRFPPKPSPAASAPIEVVPARFFPGVDAASAIVLKAAAARFAPGVEVRDRPATTGGKALTSWEEAGTWVEWEFEAPGGRYAALLRCATGHPDSVRILAVDGKDAGRLALPASGGFGGSAAEWRQQVACAEPGRPLLITVPPGNHTLRLTRESGGLALDYVALVPLKEGQSVRLDTPSTDPPVLLAHYSFDGHLGKSGDARAAVSQSPPPAVLLTDSYRGKGDDGFEGWLNLGDYQDEARAICQFLLPRETLEVEALQYEAGAGPLQAYSVLLLAVDAPDLSAPEKGRLLCTWKGDGSQAGVRTLKFADAAPAAPRGRLEAGKAYALLFLHDPDGDRRPNIAKDGTSTGIGIRADRNSPANPKLLWYQKDRWTEQPYAVWVNAVTDLARLGEQAPRFVEGKSGQALALDARFHGAFPVPADFLSKPGSVELWVQPSWELTNTSTGQRALFHVMGERPFRSALTLCGIYSDIRVRLYDDHGHLCGTLEAPAGHWKKGEWHHVALSWAPGRLSLALDGEEAASGHATLPAGPVKMLFLGWRPGNWQLNAAVDDLKVYRGCLPAAVVTGGR